MIISHQHHRAFKQEDRIMSHASTRETRDFT
jgi:hypothetical protein